ncbi:hypothetical protein [Amycolatopsis sp. NPDC059021]|uniref:hypothetical protein n=1 Tax=Amycolatopsis sp. NPDC059021 TaxID=3346704 RepID=UPI00366C9857
MVMQFNLRSSDLLAGSIPCSVFPALLITGTANLVAMVVCRDPEALYQYVNERIGSFDSVR